MKKGNKNRQTVVTTIVGKAEILEDKSFQFKPDNEARVRVQGFRRRGVATLLPNGHLGFLATPCKKSTTQKLKRSLHGSLSANEDNYYLYIRVDKTESDFKKLMEKEAIELLEE